MHAEPVPGAEIAEGRHRARAAAAEGEARPDHDLPGAEEVPQHSLGEVGGRPGGEHVVERQDDDGVDSKSAGELGPPVGCAERAGVLRQAEYRCGVWIEGDEQRRHIERPAEPDGRADEAGVAAVHPVEHPDRRDPAAESGREVVGVAERWRAGPGGARPGEGGHDALP